MKIKQWLENDDFDYKQGLAIYASTKCPNQNLLRLFGRKESVGNLNKLKYELQKCQNQAIDIDFANLRGVAKAATSLAKDADNAQVILSKIPKFEGLQDSKSKYYRFLHINDLPIALHSLFIQQKGEFSLACSLKIQMNALRPEQQSKALEFCLEIERLFDSIEKIWQVFDHYTEHGEILELSPKKYEQFTPALLIKAEANKRASITKMKKRVDNYKKLLPTLTKVHQKSKCSRALAKSTKGLLQHEIDLEKIKKLMADK